MTLKLLENEEKYKTDHILSPAKINFFKEISDVSNSLRIPFVTEQNSSPHSITTQKLW